MGASHPTRTVHASPSVAALRRSMRRSGWTLALLVVFLSVAVPCRAQECFAKNETVCGELHECTYCSGVCVEYCTLDTTTLSRCGAKLSPGDLWSCYIDHWWVWAIIMPAVLAVVVLLLLGFIGYALYNDIPKETAYHALAVAGAVCIALSAALYGGSYWFQRGVRLNEATMAAVCFACAFTLGSIFFLCVLSKALFAFLFRSEFQTSRAWGIVLLVLSLISMEVYALELWYMNVQEAKEMFTGGLASLLLIIDVAILAAQVRKMRADHAPHLIFEVACLVSEMLILLSWTLMQFHSTVRFEDLPINALTIMLLLTGLGFGAVQSYGNWAVNSWSARLYELFVLAYSTAVLLMAVGIFIRSFSPGDTSAWHMLLALLAGGTAVFHLVHDDIVGRVSAAASMDEIALAGGSGSIGDDGVEYFVGEDEELQYAEGGELGKREEGDGERVESGVSERTEELSSIPLE